MYEELVSAIPQSDGLLKSTVVSALRNSYDMANWKSLIAWVAGRYSLTTCDETCLLGYLLDNFTQTVSGRDKGVREKRRILFLFNKMELSNSYE